MRLSEVLGAPVVDRSGRTFGRVHDVWLVQERPFGDRAALRVAGVVAGKGSLAVRLGYHSRDLQGPALLRLVLGRAAARARYVPWEALRVEEGRVVLDAPLDSFPQHAPGEAPGEGER